VTAPFRIRRPVGASGPVVYDSPHSGRFYPADFQTKASHAELRRGEDAYVDELLASASVIGVTVLDATYPRCYIDLNRAVTDIDASLLSEAWPTSLAPTEKSQRGLGLIRRYVVPGVEINARLLSVAEVQARIDEIYHPYYAALEALIDETLVAYGRVWHVDWHSMKSVGNAMTPDGPGAQRADFIVSDLDGTSAAPSVTDCAVGILREFGYRVAVNDPYKGGEIVKRIGSPGRGVHSLQVEINRALYLDEVRVEKSAGVGALTADIAAFTARLVGAASTLG
jgi:N-formylglutamate amidohydrolase